jgi:hypothetical protein
VSFLLRHRRWRAPLPATSTATVETARKCCQSCAFTRNHQKTKSSFNFARNCRHK